MNVVDGLHWRVLGQPGCEQVGGLTRSHEWAGEDFIQTHSKPQEAVDDVAEPAGALGGQRPLGIVRPIVATLGGHGVADEIEFAGSHASS